MSDVVSKEATITFVSKINNRITADTRARVELARCLGKRLPSQDEKIHEHVDPHLGNCSLWERECYCMVAALMAFHRQEFHGKSWEHFGIHAANLFKRTSYTTIRADINRILRARNVAVLSNIAKVVRMCASKDVAINYPCLLCDLLHWNHPSRYVQHKWNAEFEKTLRGEDSHEE